MKKNKLTELLEYNLAHRLSDDTFDLHKATELLLNEIGASLNEYGGKLTFYGKDPIIPSVLRYGAFSAITLAAKAAQVASIWKLKTGESQDIHVDVRKALRRFSPFVDQKHETVNGYPGGRASDPDNPFGNRQFFKTKDGQWIFPTNIYPKLHTNTLALLNCTDGNVAKAIAQWNGRELEQAAEKAGIVMPLLRSPKEFMEEDVYQKVLSTMPIITIEKIADSAPKPIPLGGTVLSGIRALGMGHVIAGASIGRALSLHGADVLNIWKPLDWEHDMFYYTSHVGMRSSILDIGQSKARQVFDGLMANADIFFSNRRPGFLDKHDLTANTLCSKYPGLIHARVVLAGETGPWSNRVGFDVSTGAYAGPYALETNGAEQPITTPTISVVNDYIAGWLTTIGIMQALKRRAIEGGSYRVVVSMTRITLWLMSMGIFDKAYANKMAGSDDEHTYVEPELLTAETPLGYYSGVAEQVKMSKTPGHYDYVLVPRGSSRPVWKDRF